MVCSVGGVESGVGRLIDDRGEEARDVTLLVLATLLLLLTLLEIPETLKRSFCNSHIGILVSMCNITLTGCKSNVLKSNCCHLNG